MATSDPWTPSFCANETAGIECPSCKGRVFVRDQERYCDGDSVEAYCGDCHAALSVTASVEIEFIDPEVE